MTLDTKAADGASILLDADDYARTNARPLAAIKFEAALGQIVLILMRTRQYRFSFLSDLEWLAMPAIATSQFMVAEHRDATSGISLPAAAVLWAQVNEEIDARLCRSLDRGIRLRPEEWASGTIPWLVEGVGEARAIGKLVRTVVEKHFPVVGLKTIGRSPSGALGVRVINKETATASGEPKVAETSAVN
jgi:hemolysin-activating ACP:hemolysin acyltransferase